MQKSIKKLAFCMFMLVAFISCKHEPTLQTYFVDNQESPSFITVDVPTSMMKFEEGDLSEAEEDAYNSIKRINLLGYKLTENNATEFATELAKVKALLANKDYFELMEVNDKAGKFVVKYLGEEDSADEVVILGSSKEMGFGIARVLGNDMSPEKIFTLYEAMNKANVDDSQVQDFLGFFK